ncbi:SH3 domain-containing protein [Azospirillum sp.]|uniref:SH3 domain-containing protein n=1 Tax=Azospirillum sp. TaxID=34012 RepID=UPI002D511661|nr:SH3 domain-containing protein [Azospirillum sp.]HYF90127.1 SH3 domain-containing protein [Azospirillum sp.]
MGNALPKGFRRAAALVLLLAAPSGVLAQMPAETPAERFTPPAAPIVALPRLTPARPVSPLPNPAVVWEHPPEVPAPLSPVGPQAGPAPAPIRTPTPVARTPEPKPADLHNTDQRTAETGQAPAAVPPLPPVKPQPEPAARPAPNEQEKTAAARRTMIATAGIYLRATPDAKGRVLDTVEKGDRVEAFGAPVNGWQRVGRAGKPQGYVTSAYLTEAAGDRGDPASPTKPGRYAKADREDRGCALPGDLPRVQSERAQTARLPRGTVARLRAAGNLRVAPVCDAKVLDVLDAGERVTVMEAVDGWYKVGQKGKALGYVGAALLAPAKR